MLKVQNFSFKVNNFSLKNINLTIKEGSFHIIVGHTGSGKTLLLESIIGLRRIPAETIFINGTDSRFIPIEKREMSYVPQDLAIFPHLTVDENIRYGTRVKRNMSKELGQLTNELIDLTEIRHLLNRKPKHLSGGEKQRVALVRAIAAGAKILFMDEPLNGLNKTLKAELQYLLKSLHKKYKLTIVMVTHDLDEAYTLAEIISVMSNGKILQTALKEELYKQPSSIEVAKFLGISNIFNARIDRITNDTFQIYSFELNAVLFMKKNDREYKLKNKITIGIRNDEIMILRKDLQKTNQTNIIQGIVEDFYAREYYYVVKVIPKNSEHYLTLEVPNYAFNKLNISKQEHIFLTLKEESIFII
ncbi:MAG: ABC transporter ATP-binding protein [Chlorobi bacterium]|nr:ABC transporter ATP-binding protein [Chlorobiota bacterium]